MNMGSVFACDLIFKVYIPAIRNMSATYLDGQVIVAALPLSFEVGVNSSTAPTFLT